MTVEQLNTMCGLINELRIAADILKEKARGTNDPLWDRAKLISVTAESAWKDYKKWHTQSR